MYVCVWVFLLLWLCGLVWLSVCTGALKKLLDAGVKYMFVSNSDNLGATLDLALLNYFAASGKSFIMEVCERTEADKKGKPSVYLSLARMDVGHVFERWMLIFRLLML